MTQIDGLLSILQDVFLGGNVEIGECVVDIKDNVAHIQAMDLTESLFVQTSTPLEHEDTEWGIDNLPLFIKILGTMQGIDVDIIQKDNRLVLKPASGGSISYLTSEIDLIPTWDEEWEQDMLTSELEQGTYDASMTLKQDLVDGALNKINVFSPNTVYINVSKRGIMMLHGGSEASHNVDAPLGKIKGVDPCNIKVYGKYILNILSALDFESKPTMHMADGSEEHEGIVFATEGTCWMLRPLKELENE